MYLLVNTVLRLFWMVALPLYCFSSDETFVTCQLRGQLGNQLYQIAATMAYAWDYQVKPIFPELNRIDNGIPENRKHIFFRLDASPLPRAVHSKFTETIWYSSAKVPYRPDQCLIGFYQSWIHFHHHRAKILELFAPTESQENDLQSKYYDLLSHPNTVGVHVRTFNRRLHDSGYFPFLGLQYYEKAMDLFPEDTLFAVFSDRINWCKHHFSHLDKNIIFIEGNNHVQDLFLMSKLKHQIIANSTYSWWGAYLNTNPNKTVIAPRYWLHPRIDAFPPAQPNLFYLSDWLIIDPDCDAPYPNDMTAYDTCSASIDSQ